MPGADRPLAAATCVALLLALAVPSLAGARIILNRGVGAVRLGMTEAGVRAAVGRADVVERSGSTTGLIYRARRLVVTLVGGRVAIVSTRSRRERTGTGVGPGSSIRALRRGLRGERCGTKAGVAVCKIGSSRSGRRSTIFLIEDGIVDTVSVARTP